MSNFSALSWWEKVTYTFYFRSARWAGFL